jgi:hypothetical protein
MRLLLCIGTGHEIVRKTDISSFLVSDFQSLPVVLGLEYVIPTGIFRTFSDSSEQDFYEVLQRSIGPASSMLEMGCGVPRILCTPFLGKGIPEWFLDVSRILAVNDLGKPLFAARRREDGTFVTSTFGAKDFEQFVQSLF